MIDLWTALDRIIAAAPDAALRAHGLGPIAAWRLRERGEVVPPEIERSVQQADECARRRSVTWRRSTRRIEVAIDQFRDQMLRHGHEVFIRGWTARRRRHARRIAPGIHQDDDAIVARRGSRCALCRSQFCGLSHRIADNC